MSETGRWRRFWNEIDGAMAEFGNAQAKVTGRFLKDVRLAVEGYDRDMDRDLKVSLALDDMEEEG